MKLNVAMVTHPNVEHFDIVRRAIKEEGDFVKIYCEVNL